MQIIKTGMTRIVVVTKHYAIKFPRYTSARQFLAGILCNISEAHFYKQHPEHHTILCPIVFYVPCGLCVVMKRAEPLLITKWYQCNSEILNILNHIIAINDICHDIQISNFGTLDGVTVCIDYAK